MPVPCMLVTGHLLRVGSVVSPCASRDSTQVIRLGSECSYPLSRFIVLKFKFNMHAMPLFAESGNPICVYSQVYGMHCLAIRKLSHQKRLEVTDFRS